MTLSNKNSKSINPTSQINTTMLTTFPQKNSTTSFLEEMYFKQQMEKVSMPQKSSKTMKNNVRPPPPPLSFNSPPEQIIRQSFDRDLINNEKSTKITSANKINSLPSQNSSNSPIQKVKITNSARQMAKRVAPLSTSRNYSGDITHESRISFNDNQINDKNTNFNSNSFYITNNNRDQNSRLDISINNNNSQEEDLNTSNRSKSDSLNKSETITNNTNGYKIVKRELWWKEPPPPNKIEIKNQKVNIENVTSRVDHVNKSYAPPKTERKIGSFPVEWKKEPSK